MVEQKVKGTMILDFVKMIRKFKDLDWNKYLKPEDWDIIKSIILPSKWYSLDFYQRCSLAAFQLMAKGDLEGARQNGRLMGQHLFEKTYKSIVSIQNPMKALSQYVHSYGSFFNFNMLAMEQAGPKHAKVHHNYQANDKSNIPYSSQMQGLLETLVQMTGGKNCRVDITAKQWEGAPTTTWEITWD